MARKVYVGADDFTPRELPEGYVQLECIESSGSQYIDTGFIPNQDTRVIMDYELSGTVDGYAALFASRQVGGSKQAFAIYHADGTGKPYDQYNAATIQNGNTNLLGRHTVEKNKNITYVDGVVINTFTYANFTGSCDIRLFADKQPNTEVKHYAIGKTYSCLIYDNGTLVRDYVPCKNAEGVVGLYDMVNGEFYGNSGLGSFAAGAELRTDIARNVKKVYVSSGRSGKALPDGFKRLDYIQSNGAQYIDTLCKWTSEKTKIEIGFEYSDTPSAVSLFGSEVSGGQYSGVPWGDSANSFQVFIGTSKSLLQTSVSVNTHYEMVLSTEGNIVTVELNGTKQTAAYSGSVQNGRNVAIFANNVSSGVSQKASLKLKYFRMYQDNTLIRDYVPALDAEGVPCLYDYVSKMCFYNTGEGDFFYTEKRQLPDGYVQMEYIESSGTQYVDTEFKPNNNTRVVADFQYTKATGYNFVFGARTSSGTADRLAVMLYSENNVLRSDYGSGVLYFDAAVNGLARHIVDKNKNVCSVDGVSVTNAQASFETPYPLYLFALNNGGVAADYAFVRLYSCKVYDNDALVRDYVPCVTSEGDAGLFDMVEEKFYAGKGADSLASGMTITGYAKKVKRGFIGIGKIARPFFGEDALPVYYGTITSLSSNRYAMASESNGEYAVFAGGMAGSGAYSGLVEAYNKSLVLTKATNLSVARTVLGAAKVGGEILFAGGTRAKNTYSDVVNSYNSSLTMKNIASLNLARNIGSAAAESENHAIFAGGYNGSYSDIVEAYNASMTKVLPERLGAAAYGATGGSIDEYAVFFNGSTVDAYNKSLVKSVLEPFGFNGGDAASAVAHEHLIFAAGMETMGGGTSAVAYDKSLVKKVVSSLSVVRQQCGGITLGHYAMFCAGARIGAEFMTADVYTPTLARSVINAEAAKSVFSPGAAAIGDYGLLVGGFTSGTNGVAYAHAFAIL